MKEASKPNLKQITKKENLFQGRVISIFMIMFGILILSYVAFRALNMAITHDEAYSYLTYAQFKALEIINYSKGAAPANNHILNTLLIKVIGENFSQTPFALRFPNLIAFSIFLFSVFKISANLKSRIMKITGFIIITLNIFMLDFFSLARGYGLALGFMALSLYFLLRYIKQYKSYLNLIFGLIAAALAVYANVVYINFYLALIGTFILLDLYRFIFQYKFSLIALTKNLFGRIAIIFLITFSLACWIYEPMRVLITSKVLTYGGNVSFIHDTIGSLLITSFPTFEPDYRKLLFILLCTIILGAIIYIFVKRKVKTHYFFFSIISILTISALSTQIQHEVFDNKFLIERTALLFVPLFMIAVVYALDALNEGGKYLAYTSKGFAIMLSILLILNFILNFNLSYTQTWKDDAETQKLITDLSKIHKEENKNIILSLDWIRLPSVEFYKKIYNYDWLKSDRNGLNKETDKVADSVYYYFYNPDIIDLTVEGNFIPTAYQYNKTGYKLVKRVNY